MSVSEQATSQLKADQLFNDPRIAEAKRLILEAVEQQRSSLTNVRPPDESLVDSYKSLLEEFGKMRGGGLYFPYLASGIGNGPFVELADGSVKLDFITGIGVHGFGHSDPRLVEAGINAAINDTVMQGNLQQGTSSYGAVKILLDTANESGAGFDHCFLSTSGAMANENALKIALQKRTPASRIISFQHCFAGRTLALAQVTDKASYRVGLPKTLDVDLIPFFDENDPQGSTQRAVAALKAHAQRFPGAHAALWLELVQGEGGYYPGSRDFFRALITAARKFDMLVIADEIQSFARTTRPFAFQHYELDQMVDVVTCGKITQVCATIFRESVKPQPGLISQTFTGSTWAIMACQTILQGLIDNGNFGADGKNVKLHEQFSKGLQAIAEKHPKAVSGPYGIGGMVAFTPFDGSLKMAKEMVTRLYDAGLMSFFAGVNPARVRFLMPIGSVEAEHVDLALQILEQVIEEMAT